MADMIDASAAKSRLGIDDATLQSYINNGTIRAQRSGGKILCNAEDVEKLAGGSGGGDDEGTIVLTGDSDDLSIDLGKVVDDSSPTIVQSRGGGPDDSSITFGEELEVVSFDDNQGTSELSFDDTRQTGQAGNLSFTDSNTAVMTAVDETAVGATTAPLDFQTQAESPVSAASARRSVRSNRMQMREEQPTHWFWPSCLVLTTLVVSFLLIPYYVMAVVPKGSKTYNEDRALGAKDNGWTRMAGGVAGFSVEPDAKRFADENPGVEYRDISKVEGGDDQAQWRYQQYRGELKDPEARVDSFVITSISEDGKTATAKGGKTYQIVEVSEQVANGEPIKEARVSVWR